MAFLTLLKHIETGQMAKLSWVMSRGYEKSTVQLSKEKINIHYAKKHVSGNRMIFLVYVFFLLLCRFMDGWVGGSSDHCL